MPSKNPQVILPRHDVQVLFEDLPLSDYYRALWMADIQVSTATHESLGVSQLEAMHTGT